MDKKINVKITATTNGFDKAVKKAQKSIEKLTKSTDKMGKSKVDKNMSKQFDNITKASKKVDKQLKNNEKSLKAITKTKLNKLNKEFNNIEKSSKKLDKQVKSNEKIMKTLSKTKLNNLTKQFTDITKAADKNSKAVSKIQKAINSIKSKTIESVNKAMVSMSKGASTVSKGFSKIKNAVNTISAKAISSVSNALSSMSNKCSGVSKAFSNIKSSIGSISSKAIDIVKNAVSSLGDKCPTVANAFTKIKTSISNIKDNAFRTLSSTMSNMSSKAQSLGDKFGSLKSKISDVAKTSWSNLTNSISNVSSKLSPLGDKFNTLKTKIKDIANNTFDKLTGSTTKLNSEGTKSENIFTKFGNKIKELASGTLSRFSSGVNSASGASIKLGSSMTGTVAKTAALGTAAVGGTAALAKLLSKIKETKNEYDRTKAAIKELDNELGNHNLKVNSIKDSLGKLKEQDKNLTAELFKTNAAFEHLSKQIDEGKISTEKASQELNNLSQKYKQIKTDNQNVKSSLDKLNKELDEERQALEKLISEKANLVKKGSQEEASLKKLVDDYNKLAKAQGKATINYEKLVNSAKNVSDATDEMAVDLADAGDSSDKAGEKFSKLKDILGKIKSGDISGIFKSLSGSMSKTIAPMAALFAGLYKLYNLGKQKFFTGLSDIKGTLQPAINIVKNFAQNIRTAFESITNTRIDMSSLMQVGVNFEYQMKKVASIAGSNDKQLQQLTDKAAELGGKTQFTASQVGEAFEYMAMAGYSTDDMLASIEDTLNLAIISGSDLGTVSDIVTDGLTALGMGAKDTGEFVDKMTATITSSNTTVELYGETLKQTGALAGSLGVNMTDLSTATGLMANAGVKGSRSGTSLKNVLSNMASPTDKQAKALKKLGFTADETGSYLKTNADGNVDLAATMKGLMKSTEKMTRTEKASLLTKIAGKEAIAGLMSVMNQGEDAWDELSNTIENSTGKVQYWNECMTLAGKSGNGASKLIDKMKSVFTETETEASALGMSTDDLANAIALLGDDGKVTTGNVRDLLDVIDSMNSATGETEKKWRALDKTGKSAVNTGYDYNETLTAITADTQGLTQAQKEEFTNRLKNVKTYDEAKKVAKDYQKELKEQYGISVDLEKVLKRNTFASMSYADKMKYLRDNLKDMSKEEREAWLNSMGLGDSIEEVNEICDMSDKEFNAYNDNLKTVASMSEQLKEAMDEVTKGSLLSLASAIENVAIGAFNKFKPVIQGVSDALNDFFDDWHNGEKNEFTFNGLEKGLEGLEKKVRKAKPNIQKAVTDLFSGLNTFVNGGSLDSILKIGTDIVTGICDGIKKSYESGTLTDAISGAIKKICKWITDNGPQIQEAGRDILNALMKGIEENEDAIYDAMDVICDIIENYIDGKGKLDGVMSKFGSRLMELAVKSIKVAVKNKAKEIWNIFFGGLFDFDLTKKPEGGGIFTNGNLANLIFGDFDPVKDIKDWIKKKFKGFNLWQWIKDEIFGKNSKNSGMQKDSSNISIDMSGIVDNISKGISETVDNISKWFDGIKTTISNKSQEIWVSLCGFGEKVKLFFTETLPDFFTADNLGYSLGHLTGTIAKFFSDIWDNIDITKGTQKWYTDLETTVGDAVHNFSTSIEEGIKSIPEKFSTMWDSIVSSAQGWYTSMETTIGDGIHNFSTSLEENIKSIPENFSNVWDDVVSGAQGWYTDMEKVIGDGVHNFSDSLEKGIKELPKKIKTWFSDLWKSLTGSNKESKKSGKDIGKDIVDGVKDGLEEKKNSVLEWIDTFKESFIQGFKDAFGIHSPSTVMRDEVGKNLIDGIAEGLINGIQTVTDAIGKVIDAIKEAFGDIWNKIFGKEDKNKELLNIDTSKLKENEAALNSLGNTAERVRNQVKEAFTSMANIARNQFVNIANIARNQFVNVSNIVRNQMVNCTNIIRNQAVNMSNIFRNQFVNCANIIRNQMVNCANIVRNQCVNMANIFRNQFVSMANVARNQMVNISNIIRNQAVSWSNVIRNQVRNARNALTSSFISMRNVARTQMVGISNIIRNQAVNWANIIRNQAANARNALTHSFMSMAAVVRNQMANCLSIVRSYMAQIKSATSQQMTMSFKVEKTVTTTNVTKTVKKDAGSSSLFNSGAALYSANSAALSYASGNTQALAHSVSGVSSVVYSGYGSRVSGDSITLEIPVTLDGKEVARATAKYMDGELKIINTRNNRKKGNR